MFRVLTHCAGVSFAVSCSVTTACCVGVWRENMGGTGADEEESSDGKTG